MLLLSYVLRDQATTYVCMANRSNFLPKASYTPALHCCLLPFMYPTIPDVARGEPSGDARMLFSLTRGLGTPKLNSKQLKMEVLSWAAPR